MAYPSTRRPFLPRPVSWLPRLHEIRRTLTHSVRSHCGRRELEQLFELKPRAAGKLLETLPTVAVGTSRLIERETLACFLERVHEADDVPAVLEKVREESAAASRKRLRFLVQKDEDPVSLTSLPASLALRRGRVEVNFHTLEELAEAMYFLARALDGDPESFAGAYEPLQESTGETRNNVVDELFRELQGARCANSSPE